MSRTKRTLEPKYIISFILRFLIIVLAGFSLSGLVMAVILNKNIGPTYSRGILTLSQLQANLPLVLFITAFVQAVVLGVIILLMVLLWSHSIAGPLVRFRRHLKEIAQGKLSPEPVTFRETDQLHVLAQALSEMIGAHSQRDIKSLSLLVEAQKLLDQCQILEQEQKIDTDEFNATLKKLKEIYLQIKDTYSVR